MDQAEKVEPKKISNMTFSELLGFYHAKQSQIDMAWLRIMYLHAAMVGILVFFSEAPNFYLLQRVMVFAFFSINLLIFVRSLRDGYVAMEQARLDLTRFERDDGAVDQWIRGSTPAYNAVVRNLTLVATWSLIGFLLFRSLLVS